MQGDIQRHIWYRSNIKLGFGACLFVAVSLLPVLLPRDERFAKFGVFSFSRPFEAPHRAFAAFLA